MDLGPIFVRAAVDLAILAAVHGCVQPATFVLRGFALTTDPAVRVAVGRSAVDENARFHLVAPFFTLDRPDLLTEVVLSRSLGSHRLLCGQGIGAGRIALGTPRHGKQAQHHHSSAQETDEEACARSNVIEVHLSYLSVHLIDWPARQGSNL